MVIQKLRNNRRMNQGNDMSLERMVVVGAQIIVPVGVNVNNDQEENKESRFISLNDEIPEQELELLMWLKRKY